MLGYVYKLGESSTIVVRDDPALLASLSDFENEMNLYVVSNIRYFINIMRNFQNFTKPVSFGNSQIKPFPGIKMILNPKLQKQVLHRRANAVDAD